MKINDLTAGIYIHIPFCIKKCDYCDFLSMSADDELKEKYCDSLIEELKEKSKMLSHKVVDSIFIGGGTPSCIDASFIKNIMRTISSYYNVDENAEITIESNPGTLNTEKLFIYKESKINRISIGLQSANDCELKLLGRIHNYEQFIHSFEAARKAGFDNINIDVMSALPGQSYDSFMDTLEKVVNKNPEHISAYSLIIEEETPFYERYRADEKLRDQGSTPYILPSEEEERKMYKDTKKYLQQKGYFRYEISNYSKKGKECLHNIKYWTRGDYLGIGIGAASLIDNVRYLNDPDITKYVKGSRIYDTIDKLTKKHQMEEYMFLGLRLMRGVSRSDFKNQFDEDIENVYHQSLERLFREELIEKTIYQPHNPVIEQYKKYGILDKENISNIVNNPQEFYKLTEKGIDVSNYALSLFV